MHDGKESLPSRVVSVVLSRESLCGVEEVRRGHDGRVVVAVQRGGQNVDAVPNMRRGRCDGIRQPRGGLVEWLTVAGQGPSVAVAGGEHPLAVSNAVPPGDAADAGGQRLGGFAELLQISAELPRL